MKPILAVLVLTIAASLDVGAQDVRSKVGPVSGTSLSNIIDADKSVYGVEWGSSEDEFIAKFGNPTGYIRLNSSDTAMLYGKSHAFIFTASKLSGVRISMNVLDWRLSQSIPTLTPFDGIGWQLSNGIRREMNLAEVKKILGESLKTERYQRYFNSDKASVEMDFAHYTMEGENDDSYKLHGIYIRHSGSVAAVLREAPVQALTTREVPILRPRAPQPAPRPALAVDSNSPRPAFFEKARAAIVAITGEDSAGQPIALGSGFVIGENLIATSAGVSARRVHVKAGGQEPHTIEVAYGDSYRNATILTVMKTLSALQAPPLVLGDSDQVRASDRVYFAVEAGDQISVVEGIIRNTDALTARNYFFEISARMTSNSMGGGPVFNRGGEVIGIIEQSIEAKGHLYAIPVSRLKTLLQFRIGTPAGGSNAEAELAPSVAAPGEARPVLLKNAQPRYNEEARVNKTQGVINMSLLVGADGEVKDARITKGLPDGLNEQAVAAAKQMRFKPAVRDGHPVSFWQPIVVEFHLR